jgi:hypothetical protein
MRAERWLGQLHLEEMICGLLDIPERARGDGSSIAVTRTHHGAGNRSGSDPTQLSHPEPQRRACDSPRHLIDLAVARAITLTRNARQGSVPARVGGLWDGVEADGIAEGVGLLGDPS